MSTESERKSGRVFFEEDGRAIWEWQTATGVFQRNVSENELKRLEAPNLTLQEPPPVEGRVWTPRSELQSGACPSREAATPRASWTLGQWFRRSRPRTK